MEIQNKKNILFFFSNKNSGVYKNNLKQYFITLGLLYGELIMYPLTLNNQNGTSGDIFAVTCRSSISSPWSTAIVPTFESTDENLGADPPVAFSRGFSTRSFHGATLERGAVFLHRRPSWMRAASSVMYKLKIELLSPSTSWIQISRSGFTIKGICWIL